MTGFGDGVVDRDKRMPDFIILGAMKCATTTLYDQLSHQPGIFMPDLKEPNFFSDDVQYRQGLSWYQALFSAAKIDDIIGEASTHYSKLPNYPATVERIKKNLPNVRFIYVMRDPIDRLVSQYIHEWSCGNITASLDDALDLHPELTDYSRYSFQLQPYIENFGKDRVLPVFFERMKVQPQTELERIAKFIGFHQPVFWQEDLAPKNVSRERIRRFPFYKFILQNHLMASIRRTLVPRQVRNTIKKRLQMNERPRLSDSSLSRLVEIFNGDLDSLGRSLGVSLDLDNYTEVVTARQLEWVAQATNGETARVVSA